MAVKLMENVKDRIANFIGKGNLVIGICNGFQMLVQMALLPEPESSKKIVSLLHNEGGRFINKWVAMDVPDQARSGYFASLKRIELPIRHGEGRIHPEAAHEDLVERHCALKYVENVNGSFHRIAALTNARGNVMGMMPHPEAFVRFSQHPGWSEMKSKSKFSDQSYDGREPDGLTILKNAFAMASN